MNEAYAIAQVEHQTHRILARTRQIVRRHPNHYGAVAPAAIALEVRALTKFCDTHGIHDPDAQGELTELLFNPHPSALPASVLRYVHQVIATHDSDPVARVRAIRSQVETDA